MRVDCSTAGGLLDAENNEFRWLHDSHADLRNHPSQFTLSGGVGVGVAFYKERLFGRLAEQGSGAPLVGEEISDGAGDALPECRRIGFEHDPLCPFVDGFAQIIHVAARAHVEIVEMRVVCPGSGSPDLQCTVEFSDDIDSFWI